MLEPLFEILPNGPLFSRCYSCKKPSDCLFCGYLRCFACYYCLKVEVCNIDAGTSGSLTDRFIKFLYDICSRVGELEKIDTKEDELRIFDKMSSYDIEAQIMTVIIFLDYVPHKVRLRVPYRDLRPLKSRGV